jgi:hypothetical protein
MWTFGFKDRKKWEGQEENTGILTVYRKEKSEII